MKQLFISIVVIMTVHHSVPAQGVKDTVDCKVQDTVVGDWAINAPSDSIPIKMVALDDIVVTPQMVERFADRKEYRLTAEDKGQYSSALAALEFLPKIQVIDQTISTMDGKAVKILVNGVPASAMDLSVIAPSNIAKVEYYTRPPIQYSNMGLGAVVNVVTKKGVNGGVVGVNTQNAVTTGFGNNTVNFKYNHGNSQWGVSYNINYRDYDRRMLDESLQYSIGTEKYKKDKVGKESPYAYEEQLAEVSFNNSKTDNYVFSTKLSVKSLDRRRSSLQHIQMYTDNTVKQLIGESLDKDRYMRPVLDVYFNKSFGGRHEITMNAVGTYYQSAYKYNYQEQLGESTDFDTFTDICTDKYSFIGDAMYSLRLDGTKLLLGTRYMHNDSRQTNIPEPNRIETDEMYSYLGASGMMGDTFNYNFSLGINSNVFTALVGNRFEYSYFRPQLSFGYFIDESSDLLLNYEVNPQTPAISHLTYTPYYKDSHYIYVGNPNLKPSNSHHISLSYFKGFKKFVINAEASYNYAIGAILPIFLCLGDDITETFGNIDYAQEMKANLFLQWYPFGSNLLRLRMFAELYHQTNKYGADEWAHTGITVIPSIMMSHKKWSLQLYYQTTKQTLSGQMLRIAPSMAYAELSYKPLKNMSVTAGIRYPFYDAWELTSCTYGTKLISYMESERIVDNANMLYMNFVYNLTFGKKEPNVKFKMKNEDKDSGILGR